MSTNDTRLPTRQELSALLGVSVPNGNAQINSIKANIIHGQQLHIVGDAFINGQIITPSGGSTSNVKLANGSAPAPSLSFLSDATTGLYYTGTGLGISAQGVNAISVEPAGIAFNNQITTTGGSDLVINPSGSSVDFTGHTLINVAGITTNPNYYDVIAPASITTTNASDTTIFNIPTITNAGYTIVATIACTDDTNGVSTGGFTLTTKAKNIAGTLTIITPYATATKTIDTPLAGINCRFVVAGVNVSVVANGLVGTTIKWFGGAGITRQLF